MEKEWKANTGYLSLLKRSVNTVLLARKISKSVRELQRELKGRPDLDPEEARERWAAVHRENARLTHKHIVRYRGLLTKVGQAASVKAGDLPEPWVEELKGLQDQLPVSSFREVRRTIRADLGQPLEELYTDFGERPIASASVAQAHVARLKTNGAKVCVKVQHRGVARMVSYDLKTVDFICKRASKYHHDAPDGTDLIREWKRAARDETDFTIEAKNAILAGKCLRRNNVDVGCATPLPEYCNKRVLTMAFIEGWKITDVERLPFGTNREALVRPLIDAFAVLAFDEGLIHGDPHPGNVFIEPSRDGGRLRPALLDWGLVQRLSEKERQGAARWVVATLTQDRLLYTQALVDLGFVFGDDLDPFSTSFTTFLDASLGSSAWLFRDSIPSSAQKNFNEQLQRFRRSQEKLAIKGGAGGHRKVLHKIPGVVLFFLRGLEMLQDVSGALDVTVPFAQIILRRALKLLVQPAEVPAAMPAPGGCSALEREVRAKLQELDTAGAILGAQVAVLACGGAGAADWRCRVAVGRRSYPNGGGLAPDCLMPLLDASEGVLILCLLAAFGRPTVAGKRIGLDTPVAQVWPDFAQREKGAITIGEVLQHRAGLVRVFDRDLSLKGFCSEERMEQSLASAPRDLTPDGHPLRPGGTSRAVGPVAASLLRRASGHRAAADALRAALQPLGLESDVTYAGPAQRAAFLGRKAQESLPIEKVYEWLEDQVDAAERGGGDAAPAWVTWQELAAEKPGCTDALLVNSELVRKGGECALPGRGIRATAEGLCRLFADDDFVTPELLQQSLIAAPPLHVASLAEWRETGAPLDLGLGGWRLFRFRRGANGAEVVGYGSVDPSTSSVVLRLPEHCVSVLLTSAARETRHVGPALIATIARQLGLEPLWSADPPRGLPERAGRVEGGNLEVGSAGAGGEWSEHIADLEAQLAQLELKQPSEELAVEVQDLAEAFSEKGVERPPLSVLEAPAGAAGEQQEQEEEAEEEDGPEPTFAGTWNSGETVGLDTLLEAFEVPAMVRCMAARARRVLKVQVEGETVTLSTTTSMMGKTVEETTTTFVVGEGFEGEQALGGYFDGTSWWADDTGKPLEQAPRVRSCLVVEKHFNLDGRDIILQEMLRLQNEGDELALTTTLRAPGERQVDVRDNIELDLLCEALDPQKLRLRSEVELGGESLLRTGRVVSAGPRGGAQAVPRGVEDLHTLELPAVVTIHYADLASTTTFHREGGGGGRARARRGVKNPRQSGTELPGADWAMATVGTGLSKIRDTAPSAVATCAVGALAVPLALGWAAGTLLTFALSLLGRSLNAACLGGGGGVPAGKAALAALGVEGKGPLLLDAGQADYPKLAYRPPALAAPGPPPYSYAGPAFEQPAPRPLPPSQPALPPALLATSGPPLAGMPDPRAPGALTPVVCFCAFDPEQQWAPIYGHGILGNFYELGRDALHLEAPCERGRAKSFSSAEAAFHALKFWALAGHFSRLAGAALLQKQRRLAEHADPTFGGFGGPWQAMLAVLNAKFAPGTAAAAALIGTGDAFLLAHDPIPGQDALWSDGCDGEGANWLGLQLLLVRDRLTGARGWTDFLRPLLDLERGTAHRGGTLVWQEAVRSAVDAAVAPAPGRSH